MKARRKSEDIDPRLAEAAAEYTKLVGENHTVARLTISVVGALSCEFEAERVLSVLRFLVRYPEILTKAVPGLRDIAVDEGEDVVLDAFKP